MSNLEPSELPPGSTRPDEPSLLGVPEGYQAPQRYRYVRRTGVAMDRGRAPVVDEGLRVTDRPVVSSDPTYTPPATAAPSGFYRSGAEWTVIAGKSPEWIATLQRQMVAAGLIEGKVTYGNWEENSASAMRRLMTVANVQGLTVGDALAEAVSNAGRPENAAPAGGGAGRAPLTVSLSNRDYLARVVEQTSEAVYGRRLPSTDVEAIVNAFHAQERKYQQSAYAMAGTGGTLEKPPDPTTFVENELRGQNPGLAGANDLINTFDTFQQIISRLG